VKVTLATTAVSFPPILSTNTSPVKVAVGFEMLWLAWEEAGIIMDSDMVVDEYGEDKSRRV
jgi:hypothetical protein